MMKFKNRIKCTRHCLIVFWLSIFAMFFIGSFDGSSSHEPELIPTESVLFYELPQGDIVSEQDTVKKVNPNKKLTQREKKEQEYENWKQRELKSKENMERMDQQSQMMEKQSQMIDSLLGKNDTIKIVR